MRRLSAHLRSWLPRRVCGGQKPSDFSGRVLTGAGTAFTCSVGSLTARSPSVSKQENPSPRGRYGSPARSVPLGLAESNHIRCAHRLGLLLQKRRRGESLAWAAMLVSDHLRVAAIKAGVLRVAEDDALCTIPAEVWSSGLDLTICVTR